MAKAIISTTFSDTYLYFLPITVFCWNKLNVDVICFMPRTENISLQMMLINKVQVEQGLRQKHYFFDATEHKEATYAQCSRLYGACLDLPEDEVLITGDVDMAVFKLPMYGGTGMGVVGLDLVPKGQVPICYIYGTVEEWNKRFNPNKKTYQQCLDEQLGHEEMENMRGNLWSRDQEIAYNKILGDKFPFNYATLTPRSNGQNQFAQNRVDRDDTNWRSYVNEELIDAHLWRDGYTDQNHANIMELMRMKFPDEEFTWLDTYRNEYLKLL